jgi:uncharacterized membrane protein
MTFDPNTLAIIVAMAAAAAFCRVSGFAFMRFIPITPRVRAGLDAIPLSVMLAIALPVTLRGGPPEWIGVGVTGLLVYLGGNDLVAIVCGMSAVAAIRAFGI